MSIIVQARNPSGSRASALTGSGMHVSQNPIESQLLLEELQGLGPAKAPRGDACDKVDVDLTVGDADAALAVGVCAVQLARKVRNRRGTGVEPDVVLVGGEVDEVAPLPVRGHAPGDPLLRVGKGGSQDASHLEELRPHSLGLPSDVFVDGEGLLAAGVGLALVGKLTPALWALPHVVSLVVGKLIETLVSRLFQPVSLEGANTAKEPFIGPAVFAR